MIKVTAFFLNYKVFVFYIVEGKKVKVYMQIIFSFLFVYNAEILWQMFPSLFPYKQKSVLSLLEKPFQLTDRVISNQKQNNYGNQSNIADP